MQVVGLINRVGNGEGFHFTTDYPEIVSRLISNKTKYIFSGVGNISASYTTPDHFYLYARKNPLIPNATYAASFDEFNKKDINKNQAEQQHGWSHKIQDRCFCLFHRYFPFIMQKGRKAVNLLPFCKNN